MSAWTDGGMAWSFIHFNTILRMELFLVKTGGLLQSSFFFFFFLQAKAQKAQKAQKAWRPRVYITGTIRICISFLFLPFPIHSSYNGPYFISTMKLSVSVCLLLIYLSCFCFLFVRFYAALLGAWSFFLLLLQNDVSRQKGVFHISMTPPISSKPRPHHVGLHVQRL